jgi:hypothetical protein
MSSTLTSLISIDMRRVVSSQVLTTDYLSFYCIDKTAECATVPPCGEDGNFSHPGRIFTVARTSGSNNTWPAGCSIDLRNR